MLKALDDSISFKISSTEQSDIESFFYAFLMLFPGVMDFRTKKIQCFTSNSEELRQNLQEFVRNHPEIPILNAVEAFVRRLEEMEAFYIIPDFVPNQQETLRLANYLKAQLEDKNFEELNNETEALFKDLMDSYKLDVFGDKRRVIGEKARENKVCRFCRKAYPEVRFDKKAHAISEALGNKTLILTEECDNCNWRFSQTIEPDLIDYLSIYRTFYGIKGKGGTKEFKGKNFKFFKGDSLEFHYDADAKNSEDEDGFPKEINLASGREIVQQNIYRTLVKFLMSVIDKSELVHFNHTIDWINGAYEIAKLPKVAVFTFYDKLVEQPTLTIYTRTDNSQSYPYMVGEFHFVFSKYVFIVPASSMDQETYISKVPYETFWKKFKHFDKLTSHVDFRDFSDNISRAFNIKLNMKRNDK